MTNNNWELVKLGDILNFKTGRLDSNAATLNGEYPFFTCSPETLSINSYAFDDEAVLLAGNNANGVFSVKYYIGKFNAYQRTYVITSKDRNLVSIRWLYFRIKHVTAELQKMSVGTATKFLTKKILDNFEIRLPTLIEQESIANILWSLQSQIDINIQINQTLESIAQAIFKSWFIDFDPVRAKITAKQTGQDPEFAAMCAISGKSEAELKQMAKEDFAELQATAALFPDELVDSELGEVPKGWELQQIKDIAKYCTNKISLKDLTLENYISTENMLPEKKGIEKASSLPKANSVPAFRQGNILVSNIRPYFKKIWFSFFDGGHSNDVLNFDVLEKGTEEYLYNLIYQDSFFDRMMASSKGSKMPRGDKKAIMDFQTVTSSVTLRKLYSKKVRKFYSQQNSIEIENQILTSLGDTLLPKLLSGEMDMLGLQGEGIDG